MEEKRTSTQNNSIHLLCEMYAEALNDSGYEMKAVLAVKEVDVPWSKETIKEVLFKPIMLAMFDKKSTTELTTKEVSEVYETLNRHLASKFGVSVSFPSREGG